MRRGKAAATVMCAMLALVSCGGGSPRTAATAPQQHSAAASATLRPADLKGWVVSAPPTSTTAPSGASSTTAGSSSAATLSECLRLDPTVLGGPGSDRSPTFTSSGSTVTTVVAYAKTEAVAAQGFDRLAGPLLAKCVHLVFFEAMQEGGGTMAAFVTTPTTPSTGLPRSIGLHADFTLETSNGNGPVHLDFVFGQRGRVTEELEFLSAGNPFDPGLQHTLVGLVSHRVAGLPA
jgi:hypothetical protein